MLDKTDGGNNTKKQEMKTAKGKTALCAVVIDAKAIVPFFNSFLYRLHEYAYEKAIET